MYMKKSLLLAATIALSLGASAQVARPDSLVYRAFRTLQAKDTAAFVALYPNHQQMKSLMVNAMSVMKDKILAQQPNLNIDSLLKAELEEMTPEKYREEMQSEFVQGFARILNQADAKAIDLRSATITSMTMDSAQTEVPGMKAARGIIRFNSGGEEYELHYDGAAYLESEKAWFGTKFNWVGKKGAFLETEVREVPLGDVSDEPPPPPPPPPTPPKKPVPAKKAPVKKTAPVNPKH